MSPSTQTELLTTGEGILGTKTFRVGLSLDNAVATESGPTTPMTTQVQEGKHTAMYSSGPTVPSELRAKPLLGSDEINSSQSSGLEILKRYEGVIISIQKGSLHARFKEKPEDFPEVEADISLNEIPKSQHKLIREGAFLIWLIGIFTDGKGVRTRQSNFYIRRILRPSSWSKESNTGIRESLRAISWE
jgi:hypothetical protein